MSNPTVQFMFDFGSPNAYLCHKVIVNIEWRTKTKIEYVPILLGGLFKLASNRSPMEANAGIANKQAYDALEIQRFVKKHKLEAFKFNPFFPINTLHLMRGAVAAQSLGVFEPYVDAIYSAMWEQAINLNDPGEIMKVLQVAGINAAQLMEASQLPEVKNTLQSNTQSAFDRGAFGSPTFFVGTEIYFGKDRLTEVEAEILRAQSA